MNINSSEKRWILLEQPKFQFSKRIWLLLFLYSLSFTLLLVGLRLFHADNVSQKSTSQLSLSKEIVRLHVIANSDSDADQKLKYEVRDSIIADLQNLLKSAETVKEAEEIILSQKTYIKDTAEHTIQEKGYDYTVSIRLGDCYFPAKQYGDLTFPPGSYRALRVEIGEARGRNWWCVLFPCLCFVDETTAVVPEDSKKRLQEELSDDDYHSLLSEQSPAPSASPKVEFRSGIYDWLRGRE